MTATAAGAPPRARADRTRRVRPFGDVLAGAGTLSAFILRRERVRLTVWLAGITALLHYFVGVVLPPMAGTDEQLQDLRRFMEESVGAVFGPGYGRDELTIERYVVGVYGLFFFVLVALMTMLLVARHTRRDEQSGRAELVRSCVVGRHATLAAVLVVAVGANAALALLLAGVMAANGHAAADGLLFGAGVGAVGTVFAGITALTVQVSEHPRAATGMAGAALGAAWVVRAAGDMIGDHGSALSWLSPLAWSNQTRPYVDGRWWPLLLSVALATATAAAGFALSARRDVGAGLATTRSGNATAAPWLASPLAGAFRLQRAGLVWWTLALSASGFLFGGLAEQMADPEDMSEDRVDMFGGSVDTLVEGYLGVITLLIASLAGVMVLLGVQAARAEEIGGRAEPVLATATPRTAWFGSYLVVICAGAVGLLAAAGAATGVGAAASVGETSLLWDVTAAHLAHAPGVLAVLGLAALLFGAAPRLLGATWIVIGHGVFAGMFGELTDHPQWLRNLVPLEHTGRPLLDGVSWSVTIGLVVSTAALSVAGLAAFRRRDLQTG